MITLFKEEKTNIGEEETKITVELRGLSTDEKPTEYDGYIIDNGSTFIEIDTGKVYMFDLENEEWKEI